MTDDYTRLYISPLSRDLLRVLVPASTATLVKNVSYHSLQTFPEKSYGYLDLPSMEAEKAKKKLNGSILKGKKFRVEEARPQKRHREDVDLEVEQAPTTGAGSTSRSPKRTKKDHSVISGYELPPDRKVKRGWTEPKEKATRSKKATTEAQPSKYSEKEELLFRTTVPPNKSAMEKEDRKKRKKTKGLVVHEFEKSTMQPSFLRQDDGVGKNKTATEYIDGKGWVDEAGDLVEEEDKRLAERKKLNKNVTSYKRRTREMEVSSDESSSSSSDSTGSEEETSRFDNSTADSANVGALSAETIRTFHSTKPAEETSSEGTSHDSSSVTDSDKASPTPDLSTNNSVDGSGASTSKISNPSSTTVHPLEALFKRPVAAHFSRYRKANPRTSNFIHLL